MQVDAEGVHADHAAHQDQGDADGDDVAALPTQGQEADAKDDDDGLEEALHEIVDGVFDDLGLVQDLADLEPHGQVAADFGNLFV